MKKQHNKSGSSSIAWMLLMIFTWSVFQPSFVFAGGPTQPEASAFTPIGVSDMVDPFTGDFSYNIPLMDIDGYPINIAYNSGVTMDQEASWVGLGWNLNAGAITRNLRGIPDDFAGDQITKETNIKPNTNIDVDLKVKPEIFGFDIDDATGGSVSFNASLSFSNYTGFGASAGVSLSFSLAEKNNSSLMAGLSLSGSSENGASFSPSLSISNSKKKNEEFDVSKTATIGTSFNSRAGLQSLSYGFSMDKTRYKTEQLKDQEKETRSKDKDGNDFKDGSSQFEAPGSFDFGLNQYSPIPGNSMTGGSLAINAKLTGSIFGVDAQGNIGVSVSRNWIPDDQKVTNTNAFGYFYHERGLGNYSSQLDFNRDNDIPFSKYSVCLPSAFQTYDIFSVQAQGTGGSFRQIRNDVTYVFDKRTNTFDVGVNGGFELGAGALLDAGIDIQVPINTASTGIWSDANNALGRLGRSNAGGNIIPFSQFIEANESYVVQDNLMTSQFFGDKPERLELKGPELFPRLTGNLNQNGTIKSISSNKKTARELTNNQLYFLTRSEVQAGMGVLPLNPLVTTGSGHHIHEITQLGQDGRRYVFALPAYNHFQEDVSFATGDGMYSNDGLNYNNDNSGLINYTANDPSLSNKKGIDHYYTSVKTPAYAHSYLLSAVLSDDYIDADQVQGPSIDDLGSYVKFDYEKVSDNRWRSPMGLNQAFHNDGMKSDPTDDKASFVYGEKDLYYLYKVETKNYVAIFKTEARHDGRSAAGRNGGFDTGTTHDSKLLRSITLYLKKDYDANGQSANPIQQVVFDYNYDLCKGYPNNPSAVEGKLTLTKISFTYQNSRKMLDRNYKFFYSSNNPNYNLKGSDRWGTYKDPVSSSANAELDITSPLNNAEYPYAVQDATEANYNASAWSLTKIKLPSGGEINVTYESDDYQFVQHKKASQMFQIVGVHFNNNQEYAFNSRTQQGYDFLNLAIAGNANPKLLFALVPNHTDPTEYISKGQQLYFRVLTELAPSGATFKEKTEFISGYGIVDEIGTEEVNGITYGAIKLKGEKLKDLDPAIYSPIIKQGILFGRAQLSRTFTKPSDGSMDAPDDAPSGVDAIVDLATTMVELIGSFQELVTGPNQRIFQMGKCQRFVPLKSWMRLNCVSGHKYGGGSRVKEIRIKDNWDLMSGAPGAEYGQKFSYKLADGTSSGVASYEPQLGGDENPWHTAYIVNNVKRLAMDDKMYIEDPIMESQFPSPSVGYSRVTIEDLNSDVLGSHGTGKVVKEFYTARDFPTIVKATNIDVLPKNSFLPLVPKYQYLTANQGFSIELNDMHGKPKKESVYAQGKDQPLSTIEYHYQSEQLALGGVENRRLKNEIQVINPDGTMAQQTVGVRYDQVADFRESKTVSQVPKFGINTNTFYIFIPIVVPTVYPGYDRSTNRFRSATMNKTIQKFGILEKTVANQDGSIVETKNLAYDSQTGQVLATQTTTNFNDKVYSLNYPAYWKYESFGQASKNIMYTYNTPGITNNGFVPVPANLNYFAEGDEVSVKFSNSTVKGWVVDKLATGIRIINKQGNLIGTGSAVIKVIRSGYRNKQSTSMASMTSLTNPLSTFASNQFTNVLNAGAVEFGQEWKTYCDCFGPTNVSTNPYILGTKGNWRPVKSHTYLSGRTQTSYDGNTNIRKDGVFTGYSPFYKLQSGKWEKDPLNWTFVSEVTQFSPNGMAIETRDALGRYSASLYGYNNTLTTAVGANTKMQQIASGSFEDLTYNSCTEQGYFGKAVDANGAPITIPAAAVSTAHAHTGKTSIKVSPGASVAFQNIISTCAYEDACTLNLQCSPSETTCDYIKINNGTAPYSLEYEAVGNANAELSPNNVINLTLNTSSDANSLLIRVTDANGCKTGLQLTVRSGIIYYETVN
jgi:hypothetical protein